MRYEIIVKKLKVIFFIKTCHTCLQNGILLAKYGKKCIDCRNKESDRSLHKFFRGKKSKTFMKHYFEGKYGRKVTPKNIQSKVNHKYFD